MIKDLANNRSLLLELTTQREDDIKKAINKCFRVRMYYDDKKGGKGKRERYILPVVYGRTKNGKLAIRAFQTAGSTKRGVPKYKLFLLDRIYSWSTGKKRFVDYEQELLKNGLNEYGDMAFSEIYAITPFAKGFNNLSNENEPIDSEPVTKSEIPPEIEPSTPQKGQKTGVQQKRVRSKPKQEKTVDIEPSQDYTVSKYNAPKTEPVSKAEIDRTNNGDENGVEQPQTQEPAQQQEPEEPIQIDKDNILTRTFQDLTTRMDNVRKGYESNDDDDNKENI